VYLSSEFSRPRGHSKQELQELSPAFYGLQTQETVRTGGLLSGPQVAHNVAQLEQLLKDIYCGRSASAEFSYVEVSAPIKIVGENP